MLPLPVARPPPPALPPPAQCRIGGGALEIAPSFVRPAGADWRASAPAVVAWSPPTTREPSSSDQTIPPTNAEE
ncbi:hypothetical protein PGT21_020459 [Puccinia graminis f. sp. tritici]|uniref:Uncharacterized protein n=1 Tax=Puccinia graminis f. sp. tritici TaxID=56615 RepID=A0A5B0LL66_PUCGR|nr:hypothetical protein PGT21_020459 [Puccinia graminis f. sp. tritici]KAA1071088.1 hypothetical protein PGTUg99_013175 [Puccinia graminis f. sp. tritici]